MKSLPTYLSEKLLVNKTNTSLTRFIDNDLINSDNWKKVVIDDVPKEFNDRPLVPKDLKKRLYNKDDSPTNWFAWWMLLCIYGPMTRTEMLKLCGLPEGSYPKTWSDMSADGMVYYNTKLRKTCPNPISKWAEWCWK